PAPHALGAPFRGPGQRHLHRRPPGGGDALSRDGLAGPAAGVRGRLLAAGHDVRGGAAGPALHAPYPARADVAGDGGVERASRPRGGGRRRLSQSPTRSERAPRSGVSTLLLLLLRLLLFL